MSDQRDSPLKEGMHAPLRNSSAPVLGALLRAFDRALHALGLRRFAEGLRLDSARAGWLDVWAELYAYNRQVGESDEGLRGRMQAQTVLSRMVTTEASIVSAINAATGLNVRLRATRPRVAMFDQLGDMTLGDHMLDYGAVDGDKVVYDHLPDTASGFSGRMPWRPGWGPDGLVINVGVPYDADLEKTILQAILDKVPAMSGFDLAWSKDLLVRWQDTLSIGDGGRVCSDGWNEDPWGAVPYGSGCDNLNERGWSVEPWDRNYGSRKLTRMTG